LPKKQWDLPSQHDAGRILMASTHAPFPVVGKQNDGKGSESFWLLWPDNAAAFWKVIAANKLFAAAFCYTSNQPTHTFGARICGCVPFVQ
jgi:hypothetical protein